jgi:hypothetical protein
MGRSEMGKIKILFCSSNPLGTTRVQVDKEAREIEEKIQLGGYREGFEFLPRGATRRTDLNRQLLQHRPHIVHFSGHGSETGDIILEDDDGNPEPQSKGQLTGLFQALKENIRVIFLNACFTEELARALTEIIDCAIGTPMELDDNYAVVFASQFYLTVASDRDVQTAFEVARSSLPVDKIAEEHLPVLRKHREATRRKIFLRPR